MPLTPAQSSTLKADLAVNTNTVLIGSPGVATQIKNVPASPDNDQAIADWYNGVTQTGEYPNPILVWKPLVTIKELNSAIVWSGQPSGATPAEITNAWLKWQSMCWFNQIDMTDTQVRQGVSDIWGSGSATDTAIKANGVGRRTGTRIEVLLAGVAVGGGRVSPVFGQTINYQDIGSARTAA